MSGQTIAIGIGPRAPLGMPAYVTPIEAARICAIPLARLWRLVARGEFPPPLRRPGFAWAVFRASDIEVARQRMQT